MKLSAFSIRKPIFTLVTMIFVLILGAVSLFNIPLKLIPDINPPVAVVVTSYEGASPKEVSEKVSKPLEASLSTLPGLKTMTSTSQEGANLTLLEFSWTTKLDEVENDVLQRLESVNLPDDVQKPRFMKFDPSQFPMLQLTLSADSNPEQLRELAEEVKLALLKVDGVANVNLSGTLVKNISIELDEDLLKKYKLTQNDIVRVIASNNVSLPGEKVITDGKQLTTRVISGLHSIEEIKDLTLMVNPLNGEKITISSVGKVATVNQDDETITRTNDKPSVLLSVLQQSDANTASLSNEFQEKLDDILKQEQYKDIKSDILFDQGDYISLAIGNISSSLIIGGILAMLVLILFLRSVKSPIIIGVAIPYSVIVTFVLMYFSNFTLNIMTLGGLALGIGMLVDNSIVVIENIYRHLSMGKKPREAALVGAKEVGAAITASTLTTVVVFLPVVFISGIVGDLFLEFALTISFSLFASLYVALAIVPMMASRWLTSPPVNLEKKRKKSKPMRFLKSSVEWALHRRLLVLMLTFVLLVAGAVGLTTIGTQFLPSTDEGYFSIRVELENGAALSETNKVVTSLENELKKEKDVDVYVSYIGSTQEGSFRGSTNGNKAEMTVKLVDLEKRDQSVFQLVDRIQPKLERAARKANTMAEVSIVQQSSHGTAPNTLTFSLRDSDKERLDNGVVKLEEKLKSLKDVSEVSTDLSDTVKEVQIQVDRDKALQHGFVPAELATVINDVTRGAFATQLVNAKGDVQSVIVQYEKEKVENIERLKNLLLLKKDGTYIPLQEVTHFVMGDSPTKIQRINNQDAVQFTVAYKSTVTLGDITKQVEKSLEDISLSKETELVYSGEKDLLDSAMNQMGFSLILSIVFIYLVMAAQFESLRYPFVIMFSVPLIVIGVAIALTVTRTPIGITAIIGIIVLAGIVVNNAIVIVDYINQRKEQGLSSYDAIVSSVLDRVRPILMTSLTTILGLVPIALGIGEGTEINQPMGITVIGGLISSTFLTLFIIPIIYSYFDKETRSKSRMVKNRTRESKRIYHEQELANERATIEELRQLVSSKNIHED